MLRIVICLMLLLPSGLYAQPTAVPVGIAKVDITPDYPIRLAGYGFRRTESEGVIQKIWAKALVIGDKDPVMVIAVDVCGLSHNFVEKLAAELDKKLRIPRRQLAVTVTHTHTSPMVDGYLQTLFGVPIPPEHQVHIEQYTKELMTKLVNVAEQAWNNRQPSKLFWGIGTVGFAKNRRPQSGPVDHDLPLLAVRDLKGKLRAVWTSYACHCTTLSLNKISGDWAGFAAQLIEEENPGAMALISIGCGADSNPDRPKTQDKVEYAEKQGSLLANEVRRMLSGFLAPLPTGITTKFETFTLPLAALPTEEEWKERAKKADAVGHHARVSLERMAKGEKLPSEIPYSVQSWCFGNEMAMVFLPGEVVVDYSLRLKKELHGQRLWVNGYSNHVPCYIPSERILKEGGYEGGSAMIYYNLPAPLATGIEEKIVGAVKQQLEPTFKPPYDPNKLAGSKPLSPQQSWGLIKVDPKYVVELMVSEPLVTDPVAIAFGPDGRLWVAEMADYPAGLPGGKIPVVDPKAAALNPGLLYKFENMIPGGRIKVLEDTDGDGKYDKATVFLENIPFPTGITVWRKGVLICAAPDIIYAEASTGSGKADVVKKLYSGFGTHNFQARVNSLEYGLDGWVYGSCGLFGGMITSFNSKTYNLGNRDFRIKPDTGELEPATGQTQQGRVRDDFDNWFGCDNTVLARHYPLPDHYLRRNAFVKPPANSVFLPTGPNANRLINLRPQVQLFELSGPPGWPTAGCGMGVYRDNLLGSSLTGNLFTCEPVNLVVHRMQLKEQGASFQGLRPSDEPSGEFLASTDNWFRPVQMRTGPDGCIWVVDMNRLVIEHPIWIPPADLAKLDIRAGSTMGRIYRIKPADKPVRQLPRLDQLDDEHLIEAMNTPNGTQRDLAMMQLLWKNELLGNISFAHLMVSWLPEVRAQALMVLDQLKMLDDRMLLRGLTDQSPGVRKLAWQLSTGRKNFASLLQSLLFQPTSMKSEPLPVVIQMAWALGAWPDVRAGTFLGQLLKLHPEDEYLRTVVLSSLRPEHQTAFMTEVSKAAHEMVFSGDYMTQLIPAVVQGDDARVGEVLKLLTTPGEKGYAGWQFQAVSSLPMMNVQEVASDRLAILLAMYAAAKQIVPDSARKEEDRLSALTMLLGPGQQEKMQSEGIDVLFTLLGPAQSPAIQQSALTILSKHLDQAGAERLLKAWMTCSPTLRSRLIDLFLSRPEWQKMLIQAVVDKTVPANHLDASSKQRLLKSKDEAIKMMAEKTFSSIAADRNALIRDYTQALTAKGNASQGKAVFARVCSVCHQLGEQGHAVGPDLMALANRSPNFLLQEILDPNKNLDNRYVEYVAVTRQGRTLTGLLSSESGSSITLKGKEGRVDTLLRSEIDELQATGKSLMPEGLEKEIPPAAMNDLLAYLSSLQQNYKVLAGNTPGGTIKAINSVHTLPASSAEIYGQAITFESDYQNVGMWHGVNDYIGWTIEVPAKGDYDVYLDWACANDIAGNRYTLEIGSTVVNEEVAGTGGWSHYLRVRVTAGIPLQAGLQRVKLRPAGPTLKGALMDLRTIYIAP
ncbi:MAG TPA: neutral/alkaline non-lysosomal ceramidase N-terminal domain-containing protein, partial [Gemmatales bacterium]|nr:neutral/alkaline non-lysosomal ceramidase N-terminal domain-containing protein [Gemmatales bacterium]